MQYKKKICFISISAYPLFNPNVDKTFGGAEVQIYNISTELAKKKYDVNLVVGDFNQEQNECYNNIKIYRSYSLEKKYINYIKAPFCLFFLLREIRPDIVVCRAHGPEVGFVALIKYFLNYKMIYSIAHNNDTNGGNFKGLFGKLFLFGFKKTNYYISQSQQQIDNLEKYFKKKFYNIKTIKSGYSIKKSSMMSSRKERCILWVGRGNYWKRPDLYLKLAKRFPKEKFVMIMPKGADIITWRKYSEKARKAKNIEFIEKIPFKDIQSYFNNAKIFVNTSEYEGFPNTFIQAMMGGTPIISYKVNPDSFINKHKVGLFSNGNFKKMADNFKILLYDRRIINEYSKNAYSYVNKEHDITKIIKKWEVVFKSL